MLRLFRRGDEHAWVRDNLSAYHDGALSAGDTRRVEQHLAACAAACQAELKALRQAVAAVRALPEIRAPRSFALTRADLQRVRPAPPASAPAQPSGFWGRQRTLEFGAMAAAVLFVAVLVGDAVTRPASQPDAAPVSMAAMERDTRTSADTAPDAAPGVGNGEYATEPAPETTGSPLGEASPSSKTPAAPDTDVPDMTPMTAADDTTIESRQADDGASPQVENLSLAETPGRSSNERTWLVVLEVTAGAALVLLVMLAVQRRFGAAARSAGV